MAKTALPYTVIVGKDNLITLRLLNGSSPLELIDSDDDSANITRMVISFGDYSADSDVNPEWFDFTLGGGKFSVQLGHIDGLAAVDTVLNARIVVYDDVSNDDGTVMVHENSSEPLKIQLIA